MKMILRLNFWMIQSIEYVEIADYWVQIYQDMEQPEIKECEYKLDGQTWFANIP